MGLRYLNNNNYTATTTTIITKHESTILPTVQWINVCTYIVLLLRRDSSLKNELCYSVPGTLLRSIHCHIQCIFRSWKQNNMEKVVKTFTWQQILLPPKQIIFLLLLKSHTSTFLHDLNLTIKVMKSCFPALPAPN